MKNLLMRRGGILPTKLNELKEGVMKVKDMPYSELSYWTNKIEELKEGVAPFTKAAWCAVGKELMEKHGLSERVAVRILHGDYEEAIRIEAEETAIG